MWLRKNKEKLYRQYREECIQNNRTPIGRTKFYEGLEAGNFQHMVEMAGLCNICTEYGAKNFESLDE